MEKINVHLSIDGLSSAEVNRQLEELKVFIKQENYKIEFKREKESNDTQDIGSILIAILSTAAIKALAEGISRYINKTNNTVIIKKHKTVIKINHNNPEKIIEALKNLNLYL